VRKKEGKGGGKRARLNALCSASTSAPAFAPTLPAVRRYACCAGPYSGTAGTDLGAPSGRAWPSAGGAAPTHSEPASHAALAGPCAVPPGSQRCAPRRVRTPGTWGLGAGSGGTHRLPVVEGVVSRSSWAARVRAAHSRRPRDGDGVLASAARRGRAARGASAGRTYRRFTTRGMSRRAARPDADTRGAARRCGWALALCGCVRTGSMR